jgi:uncharacterized membrane protein YhaH (DUF805 family)
MNIWNRRIGRKQFWLTVLAYYVSVQIVLMALLFIARSTHHPLVFLWILNPTITSVFYLPVFVMAAWRLHDTGRSGWPALMVFLLQAFRVFFLLLGMWGLFVIPNVSKVSAPLIMFTPALLVYAALAWLVWMCSQSGDPGPNRYGPPPGNPEMTDEALPSEVPATAAPNPQRGPTRQMPSKTPRGFGRRGA